MPPFGNEINESTLVRSSSFLKEEYVLKEEGDGISSQDLQVLFKRMDQDLELGALKSDVQVIFEKSSEIQVQLRAAGEKSVVAKAIGRSMRYMLLGALDRIFAVHDSEARTESIESAFIAASLSRSIQLLEELKKAISYCNDEELENCLRKIVAQKEVEDSKIRVSTLSSSLAFEVIAGKTVVGSAEQSLDGNLPFKVNVVPSLFLRSSDVTQNSGQIDHFKSIKIKVEHCSHRKLFLSSGSGVIGEALVKVIVIPDIDEEVEKSEFTWKRTGKDVEKLRITEVRAIQKNAFPKKKQTRLDLYVGSVYGLRGLIVTMKMATFQTSMDEVPDMDIDMVMEPPLMG